MKAGMADHRSPRRVVDTERLVTKEEAIRITIFIIPITRTGLALEVYETRV